MTGQGDRFPWSTPAQEPYCTGDDMNLSSKVESSEKQGYVVLGGNECGPGKNRVIPLSSGCSLIEKFP